MEAMKGCRRTLDRNTRIWILRFLTKAHGVYCFVLLLLLVTFAVLVRGMELNRRYLSQTLVQTSATMMALLEEKVQPIVNPEFF